MSITVYNPSSKPAPEVLKNATRKTTLKGGILGIIDNSKPNSDTVLKRVADQLKARFEVNEVIWSRKPTASLPITDDEIRKLAKNVTLSLPGLGIEDPAVRAVCLMGFCSKN